MNMAGHPATVLEPEAYDEAPSPEMAVQLSIAISLKRIADALERQTRRNATRAEGLGTLSHYLNGGR